MLYTRAPIRGGALGAAAPTLLSALLLGIYLYHVLMGVVKGGQGAVDPLQNSLPPLEKSKLYYYEASLIYFSLNYFVTNLSILLKS